MSDMYFALTPGIPDPSQRLFQAQELVKPRTGTGDCCCESSKTQRPKPRAFLNARTNDALEASGVEGFDTTLVPGSECDRVIESLNTLGDSGS